MAVPSGRDALLRVALLQEQQGRLEDARAAYDRVLRRDPRNPRLLHRLGLVEARLGSLDRAVQLLRRAVAAQPGTDVLTNLGILLHRQGRPADALAQFDKALALNGRNAIAASNRGLSLLRLQRPAEALDSFDRALAINPAYPEAHADRGLALRELDRTAEALDSFDRALRLRPDFPIVRFAAGQCRLMLCDFAAGWQGYEHRPAPPPPAEGVPRWTGTQNPAGRTVLAYAEQGLGDTLQFCRYAGPLAARGARVLLQVQAPLVPLMASLAGPAVVLARGDPLPRCDLQIPLMSLPMAFGTASCSIPGSAPYLAADPKRIRLWSDRLGLRTRPRIGLAWSGNPGQANDHNRSMPFAALLPLLDPEADFIGLQRDVRDLDTAALAASAVRHFGSGLADFADTAALAELVDLVISADTSIAHLAGALARPAWVMLARVPDWRWMRERDDTPWYPTLRLFRQPAPTDWPGLVRQVRAALQALIG